MTIIEAMEDARFLRSGFRDLRTWRAWMTFLRALFGLPIVDPEELRLFRDSTSLESPPTSPAREAYVIAGRRSGKSTISAAVAVYLATCRNWREILRRGETGFVFVIATDKDQAAIIKRYVSAFLHASPSYRALIEKETRAAIKLRNGAAIEIKTASFRAVRGYTLIAAILEELAFWRSAENYANVDREILAAVRPALGNVPGALLLGISTAYNQAGMLFDAFRRFYGKPGSVLVWRAPTLTMNPSYSRDEVERAIAEDYESAKAEYLSEWRLDISAFLTFDAVQSCVVPGRLEIAPIKEAGYVAFLDPSGGRVDSFTLAIAHRSKAGRAVLDAVRESRPPFNPQNIVREYAALIKKYKPSRIEADRYAGEWVTESFSREGIEVKPSEMTVSELYLEMLPLIQSGGVELLDIPRMVSQLTNLERRTRTGGRDLITHAVGLHDDLSNAVAGACVMASKRGDEGPFIYALKSSPFDIFDDRPTNVLSRDDVDAFFRRKGR